MIQTSDDHINQVDYENCRCQLEKPSIVASYFIISADKTKLS